MKYFTRQVFSEYTGEETGIAVLYGNPNYKESNFVEHIYAFKYSQVGGVENRKIIINEIIPLMAEKMAEELNKSITSNMGDLINQDEKDTYEKIIKV